jgi:hypothetical protein
MENQQPLLLLQRRSEEPTPLSLSLSLNAFSSALIMSEKGRENENRLRERERENVRFKRFSCVNKGKVVETNKALKEKFASFDPHTKL